MSHSEKDLLVPTNDKKPSNNNHSNNFKVVTLFAVIVALVSIGITVFLVIVRPQQIPEVVTLPGVNKGGGDRPYGPAWNGRSPVIARNGVAATSHPLATEAAIDVLRKGGNAVDAAIAANAVLGLMEPTGSGIGGDLMAIVWDPVSKNVYGLNAGGRSSLREDVTFEFMANQSNGPYIPNYGYLPVNVPGCVDGWFELYNRFGSKNLNMSDILKYAIDYANDGFPLTQIIAPTWRSNVQGLNASNPPIPTLQENFIPTYTINGVPPREGQIFTNRDLARTLSTIATEGRDAFYNGSLTDIMANYFEKLGCCLTREDFERHTSTWETPITTTYKDYTVHQLHPNTQGLATLQILNILEAYNLTGMGHNSANFLHVSVEAKKLAFADRAHYYADQNFFNDTCILPVLLSKGYAAQRRSLINMQKTMQTVDAGNPCMDHGDTIYLTTADKSGMMVSFIQSNYMGMGSGLVPDGLGFCFQNRGQLFDIQNKSAANAYDRGKRPFHTIIPAFVTDKDGDPFLSFGVMGGGMQPQGQAQVLINIIDFKMDVQAAGDMARWYHWNGNEPTGQVMVTGGTLSLESGISEDVKNELSNRGHQIRYAGTQPYGGYQAIMWDKENGVFRAASEMRKDGHAAGF